MKSVLFVSPRASLATMQQTTPPCNKQSHVLPRSAARAARRAAARGAHPKPRGKVPLDQAGVPCTWDGVRGGWMSSSGEPHTVRRHAKRRSDSAANAAERALGRAQRAEQLRQQRAQQAEQRLEQRHQEKERKRRQRDLRAAEHHAAQKDKWPKQILARVRAAPNSVSAAAHAARIWLEWPRFAQEAYAKGQIVDDPAYEPASRAWS